MILFMMHGLCLATLALWLSIACVNNVLDRRTNQILLHRMFSMSLLQQDGVLGQRLLARAWTNPQRSVLALWCVVIVQAVISCWLWFALILTVAAAWHFISPATARVQSEMAVMSFFSLWAFFLCGGLWFGYWIKMPLIQLTHLLLMFISLLVLLLLQLT